MTKKETEFVISLLNKIKFPDEQVSKALAYLHKDLAQYDSRKGQLRVEYEVEELR